MIKIIRNVKSDTQANFLKVAYYTPPFNFGFDLVYIFSQKYWFACLLSIIAHELTHCHQYFFICKKDETLWNNLVEKDVEFLANKVDKFVYRLFGGK